MWINRCRLIKTIDINTPNFIIKELAKFESVLFNEGKLRSSYDYKLKLIVLLKENVNKIEIKKTKGGDYYEKKSLGIIANFVNYDKKVKWGLGKVTKAFRRIVRYYKHENYENLNPKFVYGVVDENNINKVDCITTYGACVYFGIRNINEHNIEYKLKEYLNFTEYNLKKRIIMNLDSFSKVEMYNLLKTKLKLGEKKIDYERLGAIMIGLKCNKSLIWGSNEDGGEENKSSTFSPKTPEEAICFAAYVYKVDISNHDDPVLTLKKIGSNPQYKNMCRSLKEKFNPKLPRCFYERSDLFNLAINFGFSKENLTGNIYEVCTSMCGIMNFKHGIRNGYINPSTPVYKDLVEDLDYGRCLTYGNDKTRYVIQYAELRDVFDNYKEFFIPYDTKKLFSSINLSKLKGMCKNNPFNDSAKKGLLFKINQILSSRSNLTESEKSLIELYKGVPEKVEKAVIGFVEVSMFMRSWDGESKYPLTSDETLVGDKELHTSRICISLSQFRDYIKKNEIEDIFLGLPLCDYVDGNYVRSTMKEKGFTIGDRIKILTDYENINSCIRTSSNWFLASISKVGFLLKMDLGFNIDEISKIA